VITYLSKMVDAFAAGVGAARAVMDERLPVLVEDVIDREACSCPRPRVVLIHDAHTECGVSQWMLIETSLSPLSPTETVPRYWIQATFDVLAAEADRRDGVIR
jgi:hypothetical protein